MSGYTHVYMVLPLEHKSPISDHTLEKKILPSYEELLAIARQ